MPSYLIADGSELEPDWFEGAETVGITAGASAPEVLVEDVIDALRRLGPVEVTTLTGPRGDHRIPLAGGIDRRHHGQPGITAKSRSGAASHKLTEGTDRGLYRF